MGFKIVVKHGLWFIENGLWALFGGDIDTKYESIFIYSDKTMCGTLENQYKPSQNSRSDDLNLTADPANKWPRYCKNWYLPQLVYSEFGPQQDKRKRIVG